MKVRITRASRDLGSDLPAHFPGWLKERFGSCFAQISADSTLKLRAAVKDVARAMCRSCQRCGAYYEDGQDPCTCGGPTIGQVPVAVEELAKRFRMPPQGLPDVKFALGYATDDLGWVKGSSEPGHDGSDPNLVEYINCYPEHWEVVKRALGLSRQKTKHAAGFVIASEPIGDFIPLMTVADEEVTSFNMESVEAVGGVKMDFLVVSAIKDIGDAVHLIQARHLGLPPRTRLTREQRFRALPPPSETDLSVPWAYRGSTLLPDHVIDGRLVHGQRLVPCGSGYADIWDLPQDQAVFAEVAAGKTETVFQFNTSGARRWLTHFNHDKPDGRKVIDSVEAMAVFTALDRPGPLDVMVASPDGGHHNMLVEYARLARGLPASPDSLPAMVGLLPETHGIMVYQEDLQRVYQTLTGCSGPEAEEFRRNVAKKKKEKVDAAFVFFMERASGKVGEVTARQVWETMRTWAAYGFNKSHAVCYAVIAYATAYLKHHFPLEWWCAVLGNADKDEINEKLWAHVSHLVDLPDIRQSRPVFAIVESDRIRAPLSLLHGIGERAHQQLCRYAPYESLADFAAKVERVRIEERARGGASSLKKNVVKALIAAGCLDSVLSPGDTDQAKMQSYLDAVHAVEEARHKAHVEAHVLDPAYVAAVRVWEQRKAEHERLHSKKTKGCEDCREKKPKLDCSECKRPKRETADPEPELTAVERYQTRKAVLPAYGIDLRPLAATDPRFARPHAPGGAYIRYASWNRVLREEQVYDLCCVGAREFRAAAEAHQEPGDRDVRAVVAYVEAVKAFDYGPSKSKSALKLTIDVGGDRHQLVAWPNKDGGLPKWTTGLEAGAVVVLVLQRSDNREFAIRWGEVLAESIEKKRKRDKEKKEKEDEEKRKREEVIGAGGPLHGDPGPQAPG